MFCKRCGAQLSDRAAFCPRCGTPCRMKQQQVVTAPAKKQYVGIWIALAAVLAAGVLVTIFLGIVPLLQQQPDSPGEERHAVVASRKTTAAETTARTTAKAAKATETESETTTTAAATQLEPQTAPETQPPAEPVLSPEEQRRNAVVEAVLRSETTWLSAAQNELPEGYTYATKSGENEGWFQDLDMDGTPEWIVGGAYAGLGEQPSSIYYIYQYRESDGTMQPVSVQDYNEERSWFSVCIDGTPQGGSTVFQQQMQLIGDEDGSYFYTIHNLYLYTSGPGGVESLRTFSLQKNGGSPVFQGMGANNLLYLQVDANGNPSGEYSSFFADGVKVETPREIYDAYMRYFQPKTPYTYSIHPIPCTVSSAGMSGLYDTMSAAEKQQALLASYDGWSVQEAPAERWPMVDKVKHLP